MLNAAFFGISLRLKCKTFYCTFKYTCYTKDVFAFYLSNAADMFGMHIKRNKERMVRYFWVVGNSKIMYNATKEWGIRYQIY